MRKKIWHFSKKTTIWLYRFFEAFVALVLVIFGLVFWKLYTEPMDAKFMLPTLSEVLLPEDSQYSLDVDTAVLSAGFYEDGLFHLKIKDLKLIRPDQTVVIRLPNVSLSYGFFHVLTLNYLPDRLTIHHPRIQMNIDKDGQWSLANESEKDEKVQAEKKATIKWPQLERILKHALSFQRIVVTDGVLHVTSQEQDFIVPQFGLQLYRQYGFRHVAHFKAVVKTKDHLIDINTKATYNRFMKNLDIEMMAGPVYLADFGQFVPILKQADFPVGVVLNAEFSNRKKRKNIIESLEKLQFQIKTASAGTLVLPSPIHNTYFLESAEINGVATEGFKILKIGQSEVNLKHGISASLQVDVSGMDVFFKKQKLDVLKTILKAQVKNVPMDQVTEVWPAECGPDAHAWVKEHLKSGMVPTADFTLTFNGGEMVDVFGDVKTEGVLVDYLPEMPAVENVSADVLLYPNEVKILASKGNVGSVKLLDGKLLFSPLDAEVTNLNILLDLKGPISEMLLAIDKKPLSLLEDVKFDWKKIQGNAETKVQLDMPLDETRISDELLVKVEATGEDIGTTFKKIPFTLSDGMAKLSVTNEQLDLTGEIKYQGQPLTITWQEDFTPPKKTTSSYALKGKIDAKTLQPFVSDIEKYVSGPVDMDITLKRIAPKRLWEGKGLFDFKNSSFVLHPLSTKKNAKEQAVLELNIADTKADWSVGMGQFDLTGTSQKEPLSLKGSVAWGKQWEFQVEEAKSKDNQFHGFAKKQDDSFIFDLEGDSWNLSQLKEMPLLQKSNTTEEKTVLPKDIVLKARLNKLILNKSKPLKDVIITGERKKNFWKYFQVEAVAKTPFGLLYAPEKNAFQGGFADFGMLMSYLDISDRFSGGKGYIDSKQDKTGLVSGIIKIENTELMETGFMLQAMSILGIVDAIRGKNIVFDEILVPFEFSPAGEFKLGDAYAASSNIGVTFHGIINWDALDIAGAVIPAYLVNSLPGKIPLIGALFREGEGGGLIGAKYSLEGSPFNPELEFHPLSSIAPGALGYIF